MRFLIITFLFSFFFLAIKAQTVSMVEDIYPGYLSSNPNAFIEFNNQLLFTAKRGTSTNLWLSDGTEAGTYRFHSVQVNYHKLLKIGNTVFFQGYDSSNGTELWKTDGTSAGTVKVKDIYPGVGGSVPTDFKEFNGECYFRAQTQNGGNELWKTDGTEAGTIMVKDIHPAGSSSPRGFKVLGDRLLFWAYQPNIGLALWKTDGTEAGTILVKDINPSNGNGSNLRLLDVINDNLFFWENDGIHGTELWKTDGTTSGTQLVKDIQPGISNGNDAIRKSKIVLNGELYFIANDGNTGSELWKTDGTEAGTVLVKDIRSGGSSFPNYLTSFNGHIYFSAISEIAGMVSIELWKSDGTEAGTYSLKETSNEPIGSYPTSITIWGNQLVYVSNKGSSIELWMTDGTAEGTYLGRNLNCSNFTPIANRFKVVGNHLFFSIYTEDGYELWQAHDLQPLEIDVEVLEVTAESCPESSDGSIALTAYCTNCSALEYSIDGGSTYESSPDYSGLSTGDYTIMVRDECATHIETTIIVNIPSDNIPPVASCQNIYLEADSDGQISFDPSDLNLDSYDNCGILTFQIAGANIDCYHAGEQVVTLSISDENGNISTCLSTITIGTDTDCDGVADPCDVCPGGDDKVDNNGDGLPDCKNFPGMEYLSNAWTCGKKNNKVFITHPNGNTLCISPNAVTAHLANGAFIGPIGNAGCMGMREANITLIQGTIYPNPAQGQTRISIPQFQGDKVIFQLFNTIGKRVFQETYNSFSGKSELNLNNFQSGIYIIHFRNDKGENWTDKLFIL